MFDARPAEAFTAARAAGAGRLPIEAWEKAAKTAECRLEREATSTRLLLM